MPPDASGAPQTRLEATGIEAGYGSLQVLWGVDLQVGKGETIVLQVQPVDDPNAFEYRFATKALGGKAQIGVMRGGREQQLAIALEAAPDSGVPPVKLRSRSPLHGATVADISPAVADEMRLDPDAKGVVVMQVEDNSPAATLGLQRGDVVLSINNAAVDGTRELERLLGSPQRVWRLQIGRGGQVLSTVVGGWTTG